MTAMRKQIRDAVKAAIETNVTALDGRVTGLRTYARGKDRLPDCEVVTVSEEAARISQDDAERSMHTIGITVFDAVTASGDVQDRLDAIAESIVDALAGDATIDSLCDGFQSVSYEFDTPEGGEDQPAALTITCIAMTLE